MKSIIVCRTNKAKFLGVDYDSIQNKINLWQYPYSMKGWDGFIGQWRLKKLK